MKDHCDFNILTQGKPCVGGSLCDMCKVPLAYGWQHVCIKGKPTMTRAFIWEAEREAIIESYRKKISEIEKVIAEFEKIPSKEEYDG